jgi:type II secretory pathway predicted ATPase ExeA
MIETLQAHWGFTIMPFGSAIPVASLFSSAGHSEAVARLRWLISARGLGVLTGEVGSGKTVAARAAADGLDASRNTLIYLANPQIGTRGLHGAIATALGQAPRFHHATLIPQVEAALAAEAEERNRHVILAIDESHLMSGDQLEAIRMLTNGGMDYRSPLTILLIGQPTLRRRLRVGDMAALDQRIQLRYHIPAPALTAGEASGYIRAHLSLAGRSDTLFSDDAVRAIHGQARGLPRAINRLAITALLAAYATGKTIVDQSSARTAISEEATAATD